MTPLTTPIGATDTTFTVDFTFGQSVGITPGMVEIDSEQLYITTIDQGTGICTVANGFGRGYAGTTASSHAAGARIVSRPKFPRIWIFKQLNEIIGSLYPQLFAIGSTILTVTFPSNTYVIPGTPPIDILDAQWQDPLGNWVDCQSYRVDPYDGTFRLGSGAMVGRPLRILYADEPQGFTSETDDFVSVTGLPSSVADVLTLGAVAKQVPGLDISRAQTSSVEQQARSSQVPPGAGVSVAKYIMAEYQDRLKNEAASLRRQYRTKMRKTW